MNLDFVWDDNCIYSLVSDFSSNKIDATEYNDKIAFLSDIYYSLDEDNIGNIFVNSDLLSTEIGDECIAQYVFGNPDVCRDTLLAFARNIGQSTDYEPLDVFNEDIFNISSSSADCYLSINGGGVISTRQIEVNNWWNIETMYKAETTVDLKKIYRSHVKNSKVDESVIWEYSDILWSNLYFHPKEPSLSNLKVNLQIHFELIINHFSYINDYVLDEYKAHLHNFESRASALYGVDLSFESTKTHKNRGAMKERVIKIEGHDVLCELHTKITFDKGRIHLNFGDNVHPDVLKKTNGKVIIGMLVEHLTV